MEKKKPRHGFAWRGDPIPSVPGHPWGNILEDQNQALKDQLAYQSDGGKKPDRKKYKKPEGMDELQFLALMDFIFGQSSAPPIPTPSPTAIPDTGTGVVKGTDNSIEEQFKDIMTN
jgi:hypothetical protein